MTAPSSPSSTCVWRTSHVGATRCGRTAKHVAVHPIGDERLVCRTHARTARNRYGCDLRPLNVEEVSP